MSMQLSSSNPRFVTSQLVHVTAKDPEKRIPRNGKIMPFSFPPMPSHQTCPCLPDKRCKRQANVPVMPIGCYPNKLIGHLAANSLRTMLRFPRLSNALSCSDASSKDQLTGLKKQLCQRRAAPCKPRLWKSPHKMTLHRIDISSSP